MYIFFLVLQSTEFWGKRRRLCVMFDELAKFQHVKKFSVVLSWYQIAFPPPNRICSKLINYDSLVPCSVTFGLIILFAVYSWSKAAWANHFFCNFYNSWIWRLFLLMFFFSYLLFFLSPLASIISYKWNNDIRASVS